jgi:broad specificity phosphatase PhoE
MALSLPKGLTLYFSRHGKTEANVEKLFQGHTVDTPLTKRGHQQAKDIAKILKREVDDPGDLKFFSSPMQRARTTMEIVREHLGLPIKDYSTDARLTEIDLGEWDGLTHKQARALDPKFFDKRERDKWNVRVPGGEDYADVAKRAERWIANLKHDTFAISHGAFSRILRGLFAGMTAQQMSDLDEPQGVVFRARVSKVKQLDLK